MFKHPAMGSNEDVLYISQFTLFANTHKARKNRVRSSNLLEKSRHETDLHKTFLSKHTAQTRSTAPERPASSIRMITPTVPWHSIPTLLTSNTTSGGSLFLIVL